MDKKIFSRDEFERRVELTKQRMQAAGIDCLIAGGPADMNWLTGFDAWSFYVPQIVALSLDDPYPVWIGRAMDAVSGPMTAWMPAAAFEAYPETLIHRDDAHPGDHMGAFLRQRGWDGKRVAVDMDGYFFSPRTLRAIEAQLPNARFQDANRLVNWARSVKSEVELACMRDAARLLEVVVTGALKRVTPGVRQCDIVAEALKLQVGGADFSGDVAGLVPLVMAGEAAAAPHPIWTGEQLKVGQAVCLELGAARHHYNVASARTAHLGPPPQKLADTALIVEEGLLVVLDTIREGVVAHDVHAAWQAVLDRHGLQKPSRIGYGIGLAYVPDWGEHTISLRQNEQTVLCANQTIHVMLGMWMDGWGMEMSETIRVTETGVECLTDIPRGLHVV